ncbi:ribosome recycling factor, partial [Bdellovibrionota bacterium]
DALKSELNRVRSGRANPAILDGIMVEYYGNPTPLKSLASISTPDPTLITIQPFDVTSIGAIEKAILKSDVGITPANDGKIIRLPVPPLTEERRKEFIKIAKKFGEEAKVAMRQTRRGGNDEVKEAEKGKELTEDDARRLRDEIQKEVDKATEKVDELIKAKEEDLLKI